MSSLRAAPSWPSYVAAVAGIFLGAVSLFAADAPMTAPVPPRAEWRARLEEFVSAPRFSGALWGVKVVSLDHGDTVFESHADRLLSPASNAKLYAGALALDRVGGDYTVVTPIFATAAPDHAGVVKGNLIIAGRGDPGWKSRDAQRDFNQIFAPFVDQIERAGIHSITGDVVADATYFSVRPAGEGWTEGDLNDDFGAEISAVSIEDNYADLKILPAEKVGEPCRIQVLQPLTDVEIENRTETVAAETAGGKRSIQVVRIAGENVARIFGTLPIGDKEFKAEITIPRPSAWFARGLTAALERKGIRVLGQSRGVRWPEPPAGLGVAFKIGEIKSAPMRDLVKGFMKPSQNLETDLVFLHLGELRRMRSPTHLTVDSNVLALAELHDFLRTNSLHAADVIFDEGSGLSRNDLTSAAATVSLLQFMTTHRESAAFIDSLPIAGVDGTLRRRFKGTPAEGNLRAKTGTLRWASSVSGFVTNVAGEHLVVSLMLNRYAGQGGRQAAEELDQLVGLIVGDAKTR